MSDRTAIVTGASRGIGLAIARRLMADGFAVTTVQRSAPPEGLGLAHISLDLGDVGQVVSVLGDFAARCDVAVLVNNAGVSAVAPIDALDASEFAAISAVNLGGVIAAARAVAPGMKTRHSGRIINISSRAALGKEGRSFYAATKAGIGGLTRTWALELAPHGITVNSISPGPTATEMFEHTNPVGSPGRIAIERSVPMGRLATPADIAAATGFLAGPDATFITGQTLSVCGGITIGVAAQ